MPELLTSTDPAQFLDLCQPLLAPDPARSTVALTVLHALASAPGRDRPLLLAVVADGAPIGLALRRPPHPVIVQLPTQPSVCTEVAALLAPAIAAGAPDAGLTGPAADVAAVAERIGGGWRVWMRELLYRLAEFVPVSGVPGRARAADPTDPAERELLARWRIAFAADAGVAGENSIEAEQEAVLRGHRAGSVTLLWTVDDRPVALAGHSPVVSGMSRIGPVYTPPEHRGRRYGSAVTAAAVESARAAGAAQVVLFTDADYPTSNAIYQRIGFVPVEDFSMLERTSPVS